MTTARADILSGIRRSLRRGPLEQSQKKTLQDRMERHERHVIPERVNLDAPGLVKLFMNKAAGVSATLDLVPTARDAAVAVRTYLARENLPARIVEAPAVRNIGVSWTHTPTLETRTGPAKRADLASVTVALAGIAETGTLVLVSGPETPTGLNFVPPHHIVLLRREDIVGSAEDVWDSIRTRELPRVVNFITGPSRTGDIEQQIEIGVHGPLRLHIIIIG